MQRPYSWKEIKKVLKLELDKTKHILTYGTIGSCNIEHDIDTIITKKSDSLSSDFFKEIHCLFEKVDLYLKNKYSCKLIRTSRFDHQKEIEYMSNKNDIDLVFQVMVYVSFSQIEKHWLPSLILKENVKSILRNNYDCIFGNKKQIFSDDFLKERKYEGMFLSLNDLDRVNSNYDETCLVDIMNKSYDYLLRKRLNEKTLQGKNRTQIKQIFYKICQKLDELENEK